MNFCVLRKFRQNRFFVFIPLHLRGSGGPMLAYNDENWLFYRGRRPTPLSNPKLTYWRTSCQRPRPLRQMRHTQKRAKSCTRSFDLPKKNQKCFFECPSFTQEASYFYRIIFRVFAECVHRMGPTEAYLNPARRNLRHA